MMNFGNMGWAAGYWWIGGLIMIGILVSLLYILFRRNTNTDRYRSESARDILTKRYASGEITKQEYNRILSNL